MTLLPFPPLPTLLRRSLGLFAILLAALFGPAPAAQAAVDENINKGIWRFLYNVSSTQIADSVWLASDSDGDGSSNQAELDAGTHPFDRNSVFRVTGLTTTSTTVSLTFPTRAKKLYVVQASASLTSPSWAALSPAVQIAGDGNSKTLNAPRTAGTFFRVVAQDVDADNDTVSDWAEQIVNLQSTSSTSNGTFDSNGLAVSDSAFTNAQLGAQGKVSIAAIAPTAMQPASSSVPAPEVGTIRITRLGFSQFMGALVVNHTVGGTASANVDYDALLASSSFAAGQATKDLTVNPRYNANRRDSVSAVVTLSTSSSYTITGPTFAAVIIRPTNVPGGTGLLGRYYDTASGTYADGANFGQTGTYNFTQASSTAGSIVVSYTTGSFPSLAIGNLVRLTFTSGNLNTATYNHLNYSVTAIGTGNFTVSITGTALPASGGGSCNFSMQSFTHPPTLQRVDATVNFDWGYGTPNGAYITPNNSPDNWSTVFETYLHPGSQGDYQFQLDADDKARVLLDINRNGVFDLPAEQIIEHGWEGTAETVGTFVASAPINLQAASGPAQRYKMRVEHVEMTGDARCRLQWRIGTGGYANIPQGNMYTHTQAATYAYTKLTTTTGTATITLNGHGLVNGNAVKVTFSGSNLFYPGNYSGNYTVANATANTFDIAITGTAVPNTVGAGQGCHLENRPNSPTTGVYNRTYGNTAFTEPPGRVGVDAAVTAGNNGFWGVGTPAFGVIAPETFSVRWTGQIQPQFSEEYTIAVHADDGCKLWLNGQLQALKTSPSTSAGGSTYAYDSATGAAVITYTNLAAVNGSYAVGETVRVDPTSGNLNHGTSATYNYDGDTGETIVNYSALTNIAPGGFVVGETVQLDPSGGSLNPLGLAPYVITAATSTTFTVNFGTGVYASSTGGTMSISDVVDAVITAVAPTTFTVAWGTGKYTTGGGNINVEIVNKTLKDWSSMGNERFVRLPLVGGVRYNIQLESYENSSYARTQLYWYSTSQPRQIIPSNRLYPSTVAQAGSSLVSSESANAVVGGAFSYTIGASNGGTVTVTGAPSWLTHSGNVLSGTPPAGASGNYQILITVTNSSGTSTSALNLRVDQTTGNIVREFWNGVTGSGVGAIPVTSAPSGTATLTSLQAPANFGDNYGTRMRGYITAPVTGNYYFWLAASDAAELWISNDNEPINKVRRASITAGSTTPLNWAAGRKTAWLALEAGKKYYVEVLHKAGTGTGDNCAVGWLKPGQTGTVPSEVIPASVLSRYYDIPALANPGTLYVSTMLSQGGAITDGVGQSTLRLNAAETVATMRYNYSGLTGPITSQHIHTDPYLGHPSTIVFDIDTPATPGDGLQSDGSYKWTLTPVGTLSVADIREIIKQGKSYINLHTALYPAGEIRGNYTLAIGSRTFTAPPAPPSWTSDHTTDAGAVRFLQQATFGANLADIAALKGMASYSAWIDSQFTKPATPHLPEVLRRELSDANGGGQFDEPLFFNAWWRNAMTGDDQLRQRVAFALSQILVVSATGPLDNRAEALAYFYDRLAANAFTNFRTILEDVTLTPAMGRYLDMLRNDKPDLAVGRIPNENYAREIMQLFSVGLYRLWPDGSLVLNSKDSPIDTYTQREIVGVAHAFTGWDYGYNGNFRTGLGATTDWMRQMRETPARHFTGPKRILDNEVMPGLQTLGGQPLDPYATHFTGQFSDPAYQALPGIELDVVHDQLFNHPNVGPFICRQLIQRLVTSHPSRDYVYRVVQAFNNNGSGVRGDMKAVIKAILLDFEARASSETTKPAYGKQREPILRYTAAGRAFRPTIASGTWTQTDSHVINVTMPNKLGTNNSVFLEFNGPAFTPGDTTPTTELYTVLTTPAPTPTTFSVNAKGWIGVSNTAGTNGGAAVPYAQTAGSNVITVTLTNHWLPAGGKVYLDFVSASSGSLPNDGVYTATTSTSTDDLTGGSTFTITGPDTSARAGFLRIVRFQGSYTVTDSNEVSPKNKRITIDTILGGIANHHLNVGDRVYFNITGGNPKANDGEFEVDTVPDANTFTVLTTGIGNVGNNGIYIFPLKSQPLTRNGTVGAPPSTFIMGNTNPDFDQAPLNSPTVFNFFLPDYKFPGPLASQGLTTPEFQLTTETTVVRQTNFLTGGLFNPGNTNLISSFKGGSNAMILDLSPWMVNATNIGLGAGPQTGQAWTSNANLATLIDKLQTLLMAGQLSTDAKAKIHKFLYQPIAGASTGTVCTITAPGHGLLSNDSVTISGVTGGTPLINGTFPITRINDNTFTIALNVTTAPTAAQLADAHFSVIGYSNGSPSDGQKRDRLRSVVHFILTSPDYTIQR